jgi:SAM-dependent methyltransferase
MTSTTTYDRDYFVGGSKSNYRDYAADAEAAIDAAFMPLVRRIATHARPAGGGGRALDLGCAMGFYVQRLAADGWEAHGIDLSDFAVGEGRARGIANLQVGSVDDVPFGDATFDLVTSIDVIEHLPLHVARGMVQEIRRLLRPGGLALVATPNVVSNVHHNVWVEGFHDPDATHVTYLSVRELRELFDGFARVEVHGHTPFIGQFHAADRSGALDGRPFRVPVAGGVLARATRRVAWRLLGADPRFSSYLHAIAVR